MLDVSSFIVSLAYPRAIGLAIEPQRIPQMVPKSYFLVRSAIIPIIITGTMVRMKPSPIHNKPSGRTTVARKSLPTSSPKQPRYSERPSFRRATGCVRNDLQMRTESANQNTHDYRAARNTKPYRRIHSGE